MEIPSNESSRINENMHGCGGKGVSSSFINRSKTGGMVVWKEKSREISKFPNLSYLRSMHMRQIFLWKFYIFFDKIFVALLKR